MGLKRTHTEKHKVKKRLFSFLTGAEAEEVAKTTADWADGVMADLDDLVSLKKYAQQLPLSSGKAVRTIMAGGSISPFKGRGMEFDEVRAYQPGDDIRTIDWRVTARTGKTHTKLYREERERPVFIVYDGRPSMQFGTRQAFKSVQAARAASALLWSALEGGDRVGGLILSAEQTQEIAPRRNRRQLIQILQAVSAATADKSEKGGMPLSESFARMRRVMRLGGVAIVLSDFADFDHEAERHLTHVARHSDLLCIQLADPLEISPPPPASYRVTDGNDILTLHADNKTWRAAYTDLFAERRENVRRFCRETNAHYMLLRTDDDLIPALRDGLYAPQAGTVSTGRAR